MPNGGGSKGPNLNQLTVSENFIILGSFCVKRCVNKSKKYETYRQIYVMRKYGKTRKTNKVIRSRGLPSVGLHVNLLDSLIVASRIELSRRGP